MDTLQRDGRATVAVSPREIEQAREVQAFLDDTGSLLASLVVAAGPSASRNLTMPSELSALVFHLVDLIGRGCTVTIGSIPNEVTTTVAARMLRLSRPSLMKLIRDGKIPAHKVGSHTRLYSRDVLEFRRAQLEAQSQAFDELRALEEEWGIRE
ncbi:helix-turn-helix domain-containing protein [Nocardia cyriacigeorgica]|uniref:Helix-turn-helix domain-containing protein n=1 Tax=Nocardia cyriacigeorgica TaxID=135487 RepID=A0ABX0CHZ3_9NOCA|nr:helix-turn-helix domain-containing protein [Nocardia cyriacigeorgica]NEW55764.1 helix-turn-helix domain-containing protein [Nocardia cyriacigeorgica]